MIPCLNEHPMWITTLEKMVKRFAGNGEAKRPMLTVDLQPA